MRSAMRHSNSAYPAAALVLCVLLASAGGVAQSNADVDNRLRELQQELQSARSQLTQAQQTIERLSKQLDSLSRQAGGNPASSTSNRPPDEYESAADLANSPRSQASSTDESLDEDEKVLAARIEEQHQTKVESASKYRVKISGLVLMNAFSNRGGVDSPELPNRALVTGDRGSAGATLNQTLLGVQLFGPRLAGAETSARISADFSGENDESGYGRNLGIFRLREASARLDWKSNSLVIGQEAPFISPLSPTSYATLAEPALSWAGNLWTWTPQVFAEHRIRTSEATYFSFSGGLMATLTEPVGNYINAIAELPGPGQRSRRPAFAGDFSAHSKGFGQNMEFGIGAYSSRLRYLTGNITGWAVTSHWRMPLGAKLELSGEAYRGEAVGGLGGGIGQSAGYFIDPVTLLPQMRPLNSAGGWSQLKFRPFPKWEINGAFGQDNVLKYSYANTPGITAAYGELFTRNRAGFGNVIYRPRSNVLFSVEYRKLWTYSVLSNRPNTADQVNVGAGVSF